MNVNFGLVKGYNKREKQQVVERALQSIQTWAEKMKMETNRSAASGGE
jgi:hypothetical protein